MSLNMELQDIAIVHTCGICETIINEKNIPSHGYAEAFPRLFIDNNFYFYPVTGAIYIIITLFDEALSTTKKLSCRFMKTIQELLKYSASNKETSQGENENRSLNKKNNPRANVKSIELRRRRITNFIRSRKKIPLGFYNSIRAAMPTAEKKIWDEVSEILEDKLSGEEPNKKFKNLHDAYRRIIHSENHPSKSARAPPTKKWHHYNSMEFQRVLCLIKKGKASNIDLDGDMSNSESINNSDATGDDNDQSESEVTGTPIKRKKSSEQQSSALERIVDSLSQPPTLFILPPAPKFDDIDSTLAVIGCRLRQMSRTNQLDAIQQIINLTYNTLKEQN